MNPFVTEIIRTVVYILFFLVTSTMKCHKYLLYSLLTRSPSKWWSKKSFISGFVETRYTCSGYQSTKIYQVLTPKTISCLFYDRLCKVLLVFDQTIFTSFFPLFCLFLEKYWDNLSLAYRVSPNIRYALYFCLLPETLAKPLQYLCKSLRNHAMSYIRRAPYIRGNTVAHSKGMV